MTLADLNNRGGGGGGGGRGAPQSRVQQIGLFGSGQQEVTKHPRLETYCDMWTTTFCPNFSICSFSFLNVLLQILVFVGTLVHSMQTELGLNRFIFLGINPFVLEMWGMRMPWFIR